MHPQRAELSLINIHAQRAPIDAMDTHTASHTLPVRVTALRHETPPLATRPPLICTGMRSGGAPKSWRRDEAPRPAQAKILADHPSIHPSSNTLLHRIAAPFLSPSA